MPTRVISHRDAVRAGRRSFALTSGIDMDALAEELAVSRATLYRVVASRDRLLGDVLWSYAEGFYRDARTTTDRRGVEGLLAVLRRFGSTIMSQPSFRAFLADEPLVALRVLFTPAGRVHERFVEANKQLILDAAAAGDIALPFDVDSLAYVFSRIFESMWYADLLSGREVDLDVAERAAGAVLRAG